MTLPYAVIIAGGQGQRLGGVRKAELKLGGVRLIDRVAGALQPLAQSVLVATGPASSIPAGNFVGVADLNTGLGGPLAGLAAAIDWLAAQGVTTGALVSVTVDSPFLPNDFVPVMVRTLESHSAVYARWGDDFYPPNAIWQLAGLQTLPGRVRTETAPRSLRALLAEIDAIACDWRPLAPLNPFDNLNTLSDLVRLGRRARGA